ncbi:MAG: DNA-3-methyladenine glycosylase 2 family protein [Clostridia bacterium]|nr:DNA-3-methyladenine glycosylase 2 family protein [Clostridia bacterium]MBQ7048123.1 DNA-3-methyladenine glycosylase 2 family protein [Clostridia bacterium]
MKTEFLPSGVLLKDTELDIFKTFDCGQCFRFEKIDENTVCGIAYGRRLVLENSEDGVLLRGVSEEEYEKLWRDFLDMGRDYFDVNEKLSAYEKLKTAAKSGYGIHILNQEPWEALCSFVISQNNNIPRIKKIIEKLCTLYGEETEGGYAFPTPKALIKAGKEGIALSGCGFRDRYILAAAEAVESGSLDPTELIALPYEEAFKKLTALKGVGPKVANCVLLFGLRHTEAFPVDVWIKKVLDKYFEPDFDPRIFGDWAGIAQQYLFYNERFVGE